MRSHRFALAVLFLAVCAVSYSQTPDRVENFVYDVLYHDGSEYLPGFVREDTDTIYVTEDEPTIARCAKTFVYYWPLSEEFKMEDSVFYEELEGTLVIRSGSNTIRLEKSPYVKFKERADAKPGAMYAFGDEAVRRYDTYAHDIRSAVGEMNMLEALILQQQTGGQVIGPDAYIVPPTRLESAFILELGQGEYTVHLEDNAGRTVVGSEKTVVVFAKSGPSTGGYEVLPADRWTRPEMSLYPESVMYVDGSSDVFVKPYYVDEYPDDEYERLSQNARTSFGRGVYQRVRTEPVVGATVVLRRDGETERVEWSRFIVQQAAGGRLGYGVQEATPTTPNEEVDLVAYRVPVPIDRRTLSLRTEIDGSQVPGSNRTVRVIAPGGIAVLLFVSILFPLLVGLAVYQRRRRHLDRLLET